MSLIDFFQVDVLEDAGVPMLASNCVYSADWANPPCASATKKATQRSLPAESADQVIERTAMYKLPLELPRKAISTGTTALSTWEMLKRKTRFVSSSLYVASRSKWLV